VVRIKRKRGDEHFDSLLLELPQTKKTLVDSFKSLSAAEKEKTAPIGPPPEPKVFCLVGTVTSHDTPARLKDKIAEAQQRRKLLRSLPTQEQIQDAQREKKKQQVKESRAKEIRLLRDKSKTVEEFSDFFHLTDLVKADDDLTVPSPSETKDTPSSSSSSAAAHDKTTEDTLLCNYMPMVREYLASQKLSADDDDDDYVYDVYYNDDTVPYDDNDIVIGRIESFDEELTIDNEYDAGDTDSDDEENRITDIYPEEEDEDPDADPNENGTSSEENKSSSDDEEDEDYYNDDGNTFRRGDYGVDFDDEDHEDDEDEISTVTGKHYTR